MKNLISYIQNRVSISKTEASFIESLFVREEMPAKTVILSKGQVVRYTYFLSKGIVKGYQNEDGKMRVDHLLSGNSFFTSFENFQQQQPSYEYFETVTPCVVLKINKASFEAWVNKDVKWSKLIQQEISSYLNCKMERIRDFQVLTAKDRYEKLMKTHPELILHTPIETLASFLGIEPPSLSRIRRQVTL
jgi:CRP-like cAMP-binding protein